MTPNVKGKVDRWLDDAATAMGGDPGQRRDALMELEATIYDQVEEQTLEGRLPAEAVQDVLDSMGDPTEVGSSFAPVRPLLAPHQTRPFLVNLAGLFAVHFLLVIGASLSGQSFSLPPLHILPIDHPNDLLELLTRAADTLLFDAGLLLCVFALVPRLSRFLAVKTVRPDSRRCIELAFFAALVLVVLDFLRDNLLALYLPGENGTTQVPLVGTGIVDNLPWLNVWLGLVIARDLIYARAGEKVWTLALEVVSHAAGLFCLLRIVATKQLVDLSQAHASLGPSADSLGAILNTAFSLIALTAAALLAARLVQRGFRLALLKH